MRCSRPLPYESGILSPAAGVPSCSLGLALSQRATPVGNSLHPLTGPCGVGVKTCPPCLRVGWFWRAVTGPGPRVRSAEAFVVASQLNNPFLPVLFPSQPNRHWTLGHPDNLSTLNHTLSQFPREPNLRALWFRNYTIRDVSRGNEGAKMLLIIYYNIINITIILFIIV